jgi:hypothetical protein
MERGYFSDCKCCIAAPLVRSGSKPVLGRYTRHFRFAAISGISMAGGARLGRAISGRVCIRVAPLYLGRRIAGKTVYTSIAIARIAMT